VIALLLACVASDVSEPDTTSAPAPVVPMPETGTFAVSEKPATGPRRTVAPTLPDLLGTCEGYQVDPGEYPNQLKRGEDLHRLTLTAPGAVCNDGTPAAVFVRLATEETSDWVLHVQGGGDCVTFEECEARWCGSAYYDASKMSTAWLPETIGGKGILNVANSRSRLDGWNQVYFYYCSSDLWNGQSTALLTAEDGRAMRIERRGHTILESALDLLVAGAISDDGTQVLPPITDAARVWLTGTSAGSMGAQMHLDWLAERLPGVAVSGAFDASVRPESSTVDRDVQAGIDDAAIPRFAQRRADELSPSFLPEACSAAKSAEDQWQCSASYYLAYEWIAAPFFVKMDLYDSAAIDDYEAVGASQEDFAEWVETSLELLASRGHGVFGASCGQHVGLEEDPWTFEAAIEGTSLHDALVSSLEGAPLALLDPEGDLSSCP